MKERKLYNGTINVSFNENNHAYLVNGERCKISVTGVTGMMDKPALKFWSVKMMKEYLLDWINKNSLDQESLISAIEEGSKAHTKFKEQAADMGTLVHNWAEQYILYELKLIKDKPVIDKKADEKVKNGILAFLQWINEHKIKFIASEQLLYSKKYKYCGLADCIAKVDGKLTLVDFKTSSGIYPEFWLQVAAYRGADEEERGTKYENNIIIQFNKETGDFHVEERNEQKSDYEAFLGLLKTKKWLSQFNS